MNSTRTVDKWGCIRYMNENGEYHREDGPAYESKDGYKEWIVNGKHHREDGPAVEYTDGDDEYYLNDKWYPKEEWETEVVKLKLKRILDL
jgi:hypothetical protein